MCGIFGDTGKNNNAASVILEGLKKLEYRGYDSWGVAVPGLNDLISVRKKIGKIGNATIGNLPDASSGIGHTRWATHGGVTDKNAHPHLSCDKKIAVIHNGIIENYDKLRSKLQNQGHVFVSDTDSEVAVHLIEEYRKTNPLREAVRKAFLAFSGLNAVIALEVGDEGFVAVKSGSPVAVGFGQDGNYLASDAVALSSHTRTVYYLKDNELVYIGKKEVLLFNAETGKPKSFKKIKLDWSVESADLGKYKYFMLKEINEQPDIISRILKEDIEQAILLAKVIKKSYGTYLVGCGTAAYACLAGSYLFSKIAKRHVNWAVGSEFGYQLDFLTDKSFVLALSQSGETMDILEAVRKAKTRNAKIGALVNVMGSTLYREADHKMLIGAGPEKGVASTKVFVSKLAHLVLLSYILAGKNLEGTAVLKKAEMSARGVLRESTISKIKELANKLYKKDHMYIVGRGLSYPASLEAALKIKEISYIHAEGFAAGELKHGVIALIEKGTPCMVYAPNDETYGANLAGAMEMKARGGYIIGVSHKNHEVFDYHIEVKDAAEATIIPNVMVAQLLSYYLAVKLGLDPDKPRNLAKSVTVK